MSLREKTTYQEFQQFVHWVFNWNDILILLDYEVYNIKNALYPSF